jgi:hypothetical protein
LTSTVLSRQSKKTGQGLTLVVCLLFVVSALVPTSVRQSNALAQAAEGRFYRETGHSLAAQFVHFYDTHGGLPLFGYPVTDAVQENGHLVQWTERERLEWHPENAGTPYEVQLGLLGNELTRGLNGPFFSSLSRSLGSESGGEVYFAETGQSVAEPFLSYWRDNGGLSVFGYPISRRFTAPDGVQVQWFERARFEYHPELPAPFTVSLGLVGVEALKSRSVPSYEVRVSGTQVGDPPLHVDLAQGGESPDTGFFDNVRTQAQALGPALVRLDNIYNFYHIVTRSDSGEITYNWAEFDKVIDSIKAMGKEPFICLSYMPEVFSASGTSRVQPPADFTAWGALVHATVLHLNVERGLHIRYFEVWNEPNQWDFWQATFEDYLRLYDTTVAAVTSADPSALVGGPAFSSFEPVGLGHFLNHVAATAGSRVDFLSWHAYGMSPDDLAGQIRQARSIIAQFPSLHPQLFITEFNVLQGGPGDTSAHSDTDKVQGAIELLRSIESMNRERLDRAFLFELKDGKGPADFWGRWGILTNSGHAKPIYYALQAYVKRPAGMLPVQVTSGPLDGSIGSMAFGGQSGSTLFLWYTGDTPARIKLRLPTSFADVDYDVSLFDVTHNNPAKSGDTTLQQEPPRNAGDLLFTLQPGSLVILTSRSK